MKVVTCCSSVLLADYAHDLSNGLDNRKSVIGKEIEMEKAKAKQEEREHMQSTLPSMT